MTRLVVMAFALSGATAFGGPITLVERVDSGLTSYPAPPGQTHGAAAADFDGDGDIDLLVPTGAGAAPRLYQNDGTGHFTDVAAARGLTDTARDRVGLFLDYDGDGDLDILLGSDNHLTPIVQAAPTTLRLYEQKPDGMFEDVTVAANLFEDIPLGWGVDGLYDLATQIGSLAAGDLDSDGDVDIAGTHWFGRNFRYRNNGDGTFTNVTDLAGVQPIEDNLSAWQALLIDVNNDGRLDVVEAMDFSPNQLWINNGGWSFTEVAASSGCADLANHMGAAAADHDNDGDLDIYMTNIHDPQPAPIKPEWALQNNPLYRNDSSCAPEQFANESTAVGVGLADWSWGCTWADMDLDGRADLAVTNGYAVHAFFAADRSRLFRNLGGSPPSFQEIGAAAGFDDTDVGSCLLAFDADRDGDLDLLQVHGGSSLSGGELRLLINETVPAPGAGNWLVVKPRRTDIADRFSLGATVTIEASGVVSTRLITAGTSMAGQEPAEAHFGLGTSSTVDRVEVRWLDGRRRVLTSVAAGSVIEVSPVGACLVDVDGDGDTDVFDFSEIAANFGAGPCAEPGQGDVNRDGVVNVFDFADLSAGFGCLP